jgi:hypothetical protein
MRTECSAYLLGLHVSKSARWWRCFNGGKITSDAGALLLGATDRAIVLVDRFAACFADSRTPELIEHTVRALVGQRVFALALGYEDLVHHEDLRHDPRPPPNRCSRPKLTFAPTVFARTIVREALHKGIQRPMDVWPASAGKGTDADGEQPLRWLTHGRRLARPMTSPPNRL